MNPLLFLGLVFALTAILCLATGAGMLWFHPDNEAQPFEHDSVQLHELEGLD